MAKQNTFIHEMTHVWQYQIGIDVLLKALPLQLLKFATFMFYNPYSLPNNVNVGDFQYLNVEQQGEYMRKLIIDPYKNFINPFVK